MKICDNNWDDPSGGSMVETWESNQDRCLALSISEQGNSRGYNTATLTPEDCLALAAVLLSHARKNGITVNIS